MKDTTKRNQVLQSLEAGQVWQMDGSHLKIGLVGKRLVHYKHFKGDARRSPNSLSSIATLQKFLKVNKAVLIEVAPDSLAAAQLAKDRSRIRPTL